MRIPRNLALALMAGLAGCESGAGPQMSHVYVRLTDAPDPAITAASAFISTVYLIGGDGTARDTITTGPSIEYDLLSLQGGVTTLIGDASIPDRAQVDGVERAHLLEAVGIRHASVAEVEITPPWELGKLAAEPTLLRRDLHDVDAGGNDFLSDAVSGNHSNAISLHLNT